MFTFSQYFPFLYSCSKYLILNHEEALNSTLKYILEIKK